MIENQLRKFGINRKKCRVIINVVNKFIKESYNEGFVRAIAHQKNLEPSVKIGGLDQRIMSELTKDYLNISWKKSGKL